MIARTWRIAAIAAVLALGACDRYKRELVVLQPEDDGKIGSVVLRDARGEIVLDAARPAAHRDPGGPTSAVQVDAGDIDRLFATALAARPAPPRNFRLYFVFDSDLLTADSRSAFEAMFEDVRRRSHYNVEVVGHTDRKGAADYNARLSLQRAESVRLLLIERGIAGGQVIATGRGEVDPVVPTPDETEEPLNRRVEITVR